MIEIYSKWLIKSLIRTNLVIIIYVYNYVEYMNQTRNYFNHILKILEQFVQFEILYSLNRPNINKYGIYERDKPFFPVKMEISECLYISLWMR